MTIFEAIGIAEKFNDTVFTNTQEMVVAVGALISFAEQWSFLAVKKSGEEVDY